MPILADITQLDADFLVELFEVDLTPFGGDVVRFHSGTNQLGLPVVWQGVTYQPYPIQADGFEWSGQGQLPQPRMTVSNVGGLFSSYIASYGDLLNAKVTRHRTMVKYLDAVNFPGGVNSTADPDQFLPDEVYYVFQKTSEDKVSVVFTLASIFDLAGVKLPSRQIIQNICPWIYKSSECSWVPSPGQYFDASDAPTTASLDTCGKRLSSCKVRFGAKSVLPFGAFPASSLIQT